MRARFAKAISKIPKRSNVDDKLNPVGSDSDPSSAVDKRRIKLTHEELNILLTQLLRKDDITIQTEESSGDNDNSSESDADLQQIMDRLQALGYSFETTEDHKHIFITLPDGASIPVTVKPASATLKIKQNAPTGQNQAHEQTPNYNLGCKNLKGVIFSDSNDTDSDNGTKIWNDILTYGAQCLRSVISTVLTEIENSSEESSEEKSSESVVRTDRRVDEPGENGWIADAVRKRRDSKAQNPSKGSDAVPEFDEYVSGAKPNHQEKSRQVLEKKGEAKNNDFDNVDPALYS